MTHNIKLGIAAIGLLILLLLLSNISWMQAENEQSIKELSELKTQALYFNKLKRRWDDKQSFQKLQNKLSSIQLPDKSYTKGKNRHLSYTNLTAPMFDKISHAILSSDVHLIAFSTVKTKVGIDLDVELKP